MMQQRIDRLALLNEKQAASPLEPRELEELRDKNERYNSPYIPSQAPAPPSTQPGAHPYSLLAASLPRSLTMRLHETLKQCQDLKTEKSQMDRKISQLLEENGDLSFKVGVKVVCAWRPLRAEVVWKAPQERVEKNVPAPVLRYSLSRDLHILPLSLSHNWLLPGYWVVTLKFDLWS